MARDLTVDIESEIIKTEVMPCFLIQFDFDTVLRFWTGIGTLSWTGFDWSGAGDVIKVAPIQETEQVEALGISFEVQGVTTEIISLALSEPVQGRSAVVWMGFLDADGDLIDDPIGPFAYIMDTISIEENPENPRVTITAEAYLATLEIPRPRRYTHQDQQVEFPGDNGLIFIPSIQEKQIQWGKGVSK